MMNDVLARRFIQAAICPFGLLLLVSVASAQQNSIENFDVTQSGGQVLIRLTLKNPIAAAPGSFTIANPPRIAFDFPDTTNGLGRNSQDIGEAVLRSVNVVQAGERTRLVLNLRNMVPYESKIEGSSLLITLAATGGAQQAATGAARFAEGRADLQHALKDVNFRRGRGGEGRIVVELSDTSTGVDSRQQGQTVIGDFLKTSVSDVLRKRYDVVDFATPVQTFSVFPQGDNAEGLHRGCEVNHVVTLAQHVGNARLEEIPDDRLSLLAAIHAGRRVRKLDDDSPFAPAPASEIDVFQRVLKIRSAFGKTRRAGRGLLRAPRGGQGDQQAAAFDLGFVWNHVS